MTTALLLIDCQNDFLASDQLQPKRDQLIAAAAELLALFRQAGHPVVHVWTSIDDPLQALPHWRERQSMFCLRGSPGHETPLPLRPLADEFVLHKQGFSGFAGDALGRHLHSLGVDTLVLAGVHLRTCIRATAMDGHQQGWRVWIAVDACADDDPLHGEISREWMDQRCMRSISGTRLQELMRQEEQEPSRQLQHHNPAQPDRLLWTIEPPAPPEIASAVTAARAAQLHWSTTCIGARRQMLGRLERTLAESRQQLAAAIAEHTGKPITLATMELRFAERLIQTTRLSGDWSDGRTRGAGWRARRCPLGVVAAITPWNNPVAIPLGKLAPALLHGNAVVWKPAIPAIGLARSCLDLLHAAGVPKDVVVLLEGDAATARELMDQSGIAAITLTGGTAAGLAARIASCRRAVPLQAELGGNNAAIVWSDADLQSAAAAVAAGAFEAAGQRCTANRRVIVAAPIADGFRQRLQQAIEALPWGDPLDPASRIGPVISPQAARRLEALIERARLAGATVWRVSRPPSELPAGPCWVAPTLIETADPDSEIVQQESFGPILVLQRANSWEEALELCNGVRQGLAAALFSQDAERWRQLEQRAQAGILKRNASTAGAVAEAPFSGWKQSGIGPAEHGVADEEFYGRWQTVYVDEPE